MRKLSGDMWTGLVVGLVLGVVSLAVILVILPPPVQLTSPVPSPPSVPTLDDLLAACPGHTAADINIWPRTMYSGPLSLAVELEEQQCKELTAAFYRVVCPSYDFAYRNEQREQTVEAWGKTPEAANLDHGSPGFFSSDADSPWSLRFNEVAAEVEARVEQEKTDCATPLVEDCKRCVRATLRAAYAESP